MKNRQEKKAEKEINVSLRLLAKSSVIVMISLVISKILTYVYRVIIARYFGPEAYGLFSLATMILSLFIIVSSMGVVDGLLRFTSLYRGKKEEAKIAYMLNSSIKFLLVSGVIAGFLLFFLSNSIAESLFKDANLSFYLKIFSFLVPISIFSNVFLYTLRAYEKISQSSFLQNIFQNIAKIIFLLFFIFLGFNSGSSIIFSFAIGVCLTLIVAYLLCRRVLPPLFLSQKLATSEKEKVRIALFMYSWPIVLLGAIGNVFNWTDSFVLGYFTSVEQVGFYNAAMPIAMLLIIAEEIFMQLLFPLITKEYSKGNYELIKELSKQVSKWIFLINLPLLFLILIFPGVIINLLFGSNFLVAENALRILAVGFFFLSLSVVSMNILSMLGKSKLSLMNTVVFSVVNIFMNIFLIPKYGLSGAAFATTISSMGIGLVSIIQVKRAINIVPLRRKMATIFIASIVPTILLVLASKFLPINFWTLALSGLIFLAIYIIFVFFTGCLDKNDWMIIKSIKKKLFSR